MTLGASHDAWLLTYFLFGLSGVYYAPDNPMPCIVCTVLPIETHRSD